ncbi:MAG: methyltransferase domain-containing protein, partial [Candidatus Diapherotrites archaeon]|nr:methyltransferase domain-containing protein [Candidatus Diapherotrites archaeon]
MKLNLGCGKNYLAGFVNVDNFRGKNQVDVVADLNKRWPFKDDSAEFILVDNVLEHMDAPIQFLQEANRVLKKNGVIEIVVPHYSHPSAYYPQHKHFFSREWFVKGVNEDFSGINFFDV